MPLMNVPWPPSKSRNPVPSSSASSSSSTPRASSRAPPAGRRQRCHQRECSTVGTEPPIVRSPVSSTSTCGRSRHAELQPPANGFGRGAGSDVDRRAWALRRAPRALRREHHPAAKWASVPTGLPLTPWLASSTWFGSTTSPAPGRRVEHLVHPVRDTPRLATASSVASSRERRRGSAIPRAVVPPRRLRVSPASSSTALITRAPPRTPSGSPPASMTTESGRTSTRLPSASAAIAMRRHTNTARTGPAGRVVDEPRRA